MKESKLVILGAGSVGKTSLVQQFLKGFFSTSYHPTIEDCYTHTMQLPNGLFHSLEILDTAGSHPFPAMRELSIKSGKAFVIVFAVNLQDTYFEAKEIWNLVLKIKGTKNIPVVVVGNKVDLEDERQVPCADAQEWVRTSMTNATYLESSAKYNINVKEVFKQLLVCTYGFSAEDKEAANRRRRSSTRLGRTLSVTGARVGRIKSVGDLLDIVRRRSSFGLNNTQSRGPSTGNSDHEDTGSDDNLEKQNSFDDLEMKCNEAKCTDKEKKEKEKQLKKLMKHSRQRQKEKQYSVSCSALPDDISETRVVRENSKCVIL